MTLINLSRRHNIGGKRLLCSLLCALAASTEVMAEEEKAWSPPGLPTAIDWTFSFDATFGAFGFADSLYTDPKPGSPSGDLSDNWMEASIKPALGGEYGLGDNSTVYGKVSAVGERTYGAAPSLVGGDASSFKEDDLYLGWRSGSSVGSSEDLIDVTVGRAPYTLGHGMLLWDGAAEGGSYGGYWTNARKAFQMAGIGRFTPGNNTFEIFYLEKDELPESEMETVVSGLNYEFSIGEDTTLGASYLSVGANDLVAPERDGMDVYNLRAFTAPFARMKGLSFEMEYAKEENGSLLDSEAWNALVAYELDSDWKPRISYRYAFFEGDDPDTATSEAFDGLLTGFYDWGSWWQGEIAGEYFLSNSNLISHQLRLHTTPTESISTGLIFYNFLLDVPEAMGPQVTSDDIANELDWYMDWSVNDNLLLSFVLAVAEPGEAVEQSSDRTDTFVFGMFFAAYSF